MTACVFTASHLHSPWQWLFALTLPLFGLDLLQVYGARNPRDLDPFLKRLALSILAFTLLFCAGLMAVHPVSGI